ncbi:MAG: TadA family conjugal transfer-associated ATPase [Candidatus Nanopelagicales bacterium]|nr:TadA family conjugal transfer-associated ATPase [Candidatus Nanopelagicales bacterium]
MSIPERVRTRLVLSQGRADAAGVATALRDEGIVLGDGAILALVAQLQRDTAGIGILEPLLHQPGITDILVNGPDDVWIDRGLGLERVPLSFASTAEVQALAQRLASSTGRPLDEAHPSVDARLGNGVRLHATVPPIAVDGPVISLRIPRSQPFTLDQLVEAGAVDADGAVWLQRIMAARLSFLISGGTGTGKTTVLAALLGLVPRDHRIVIVEDSTELAPDHPHAVRLQARMANLEGAGAITMRELVRQTLRMRPDRIVVGEVRGAEVAELLTALNTGHEGGCGTVHANSAGDVPARIEALSLLAGLDRAAAHALLAAGLDAVIHLERDQHGRRVIQGVHLLAVDGHQRVRVTPALVRSAARLVPAAALPALEAMVTARVPSAAPATS